MYRFKFATEAWEIEQVHCLNYQAFVEEIPQHPPNPERRLVDQFHAENTYAIGLAGERVVAMLALRSNRPFSLDRKLENLDRYLPPHTSVCEIRLLYVLPEHRNGKVMRGLLELVADYCIPRGHDLALISGTTRQERFYRNLGFAPFGPLVGSGDAVFQPMYLTLDAGRSRAPWVRAIRALEAAEARRSNRAQEWGQAEPPAPRLDPPANFLPGPVNIPTDVLAKMAAPPISHRGAQFMADVARLQARLCSLVNAQGAALLTGSGTLANEVVAAQLARLGRKGWVLTNGEFGERLVGQAKRWGLEATVVAEAWGCPFDYAALEQRLAADPDVGWLWCVHSETSTGMLNDLQALGGICRRYGVKLCADCVSAIGAVPVDLRDVYLATGTSGKSLGSLAGLALVFWNEPPAPAPPGSSHPLPSYLDLGLYHATGGVPFTVSTNLVYALDAALDHLARRSPDATQAAAAQLRAGLRALGLTIVVEDALASPAVTTVALPPAVSSTAVGDALAAQGFLLSYQSSYLVKRNWIQVCLMGEFRQDALEPLVRALARIMADERRLEGAT
ncbi:MAG TPA: aminotransferase class V-fold PLP-dependent enzyme [Caldilineaceae bacterium]|nr:aminotransferase class V-fold PLP-dependent enzyme [Caldilineaceae bacterium]